MSNETEDSRAHGIEFGSLAEELESESYPLSHDELLERYGDHTLDMEDGETPLRELLGSENEGDYEDVESVRQAIFTMAGSEAVGRDEYSDRGGSRPDTDGAEDPESL